MIREVDNYDCIVVGAALSDRLARIRSERVLVVERRDHIAGSAFDLFDDTGIRIHRYGSHIFHTNDRDVLEHLPQFTDWCPCGHRVLGQVDDQPLPIPINLDTGNCLCGLDLTSEGFTDRLQARPRNEYAAMFARMFCRIEEEHPLPLQRRKPGLSDGNRMTALGMDL